MLPSRNLKSPIRPTSIRTLGGAIAPVPAGCPQLDNGCCRLGLELKVAVFSDVVPGACRSHPNSAICSKPCQAATFFCSCRTL
jgi:hypothetical protein